MSTPAEEVSGTKRRGGKRVRAASAVVAAVALIWMMRLVSAWADRAVALATFAAVAVLLVLVGDWLIVSFGPGIWRFVRSVAVSIGRALRTDPEVSALLGRHPRTFGWLGRRFSRERASGLYLTVTVALAVYFLAAFVSLTRSLVLSRAITAYDPQIFALLRAFRTPITTRALWIATVFADPRVITLLALCAVILLVAWGRRAEAGLLAVTMSGGALLQTIAKVSIRRPGPPATFSLLRQPTPFSFPSSHAVASLLLLGVIVFVLWRTLPELRTRLAAVSAAGFLVAAVGFSRVYLGVHWMSDVIASWSLALAWLSVTCGRYLMLVRYKGLSEKWPAWPDARYRRAGTAVILLSALAAVTTGALADPLLTQATAPIPVQTWAVTRDRAGRPAPTPAEVRQLPLFSEKLDGSAQEPIGVVFVGTRTQLLAAFAAAGWQIADPPTLATLSRAAWAASLNQPYPTAPVTPTFLDGAVQELAFEKPEGAATVRRRHHTRFWQTRFVLGGAPVWVATASFDSRLEIATTIPLPTHHIDPNVDAEQAYVVSDVVGTGRAEVLAKVQALPPSTGTNAQGDAWFTHGDISVLEAKP